MRWVVYSLFCMRSLKAARALGLLALLIASQGQATVIVTYAEKPGVETSSLANTSTLTFDSLSIGYHSAANDSALTWSGVGTFDNLDIKSADVYGGANNTNYAVVGVGVNTETTLTLNTPSSYFGLWWSAGDAHNIMDFYSGANGTGTLLAEFTMANLLKALPKSYYGNPNPGYNSGKDATEPFAFINFFGSPGTQWQSVVLKNDNSTGFEADNFTSRTTAYNPATDGAMPGVYLESINGTQVAMAAPEPGSNLAIGVLCGLSVGGSLLRRIRRRAFHCANPR